MTVGPEAEKIKKGSYRVANKKQGANRKWLTPCFVWCTQQDSNLKSGGFRHPDPENQISNEYRALFFAGECSK